MKALFFTFILLLLSLGITSCFSQEIPKATSNLDGKITNDSIRNIIEQNAEFFPEKTQVSIAIITKNNTEYIGVIRNQNTLKITDNKRNIFEIGSITKVFNSILFAHFIKEGKASKQETVQENFDFKLKEGGNITLEQLANHTSGLPRLPSNMTMLMMISPDNPYKSYKPEDLETYLKESVKLASTPGTKNAYSNLGAGLLGYILTKKSGKTYEELLQEIVFKPLNMAHSSTKINHKELLVKGYFKDGNVATNWDFTDALIAAGGIKSSLIDMEKFARKNFENDSVYSLPQEATFSLSEKRKVGLGWQILSEGNTLWHNGGTGAYRSCMALNKTDKKAVVVLSNLSAFEKTSPNIDKLCFAIFKEIK